MSFLWIIIVQWFVVVHVATEQTYTIIIVQWVCLSSYTSGGSSRKSQISRGAQSTVRQSSVARHLRPLALRVLRQLAPVAGSFADPAEVGADAEEVLREADDDDYEAPGWVTSAVYEIPRSGLGWLWSATYIGLYVLTMWATVGFYAALWGGGARGPWRNCCSWR